jgi:hypothetical protein
MHGEGRGRNGSITPTCCDRGIRGGLECNRMQHEQGSLRNGVPGRERPQRTNTRRPISPERRVTHLLPVLSSQLKSPRR